MSEEITKGVLDTLNHIVVKIDMTSMTEAQRKMFTILTSFVTASYWTNPDQQNLINRQHTWMIGCIAKDFKDCDEMIEVLKLFMPIVCTEDLVSEHDKNAVKWLSKLMSRVPFLYNRYKDGDAFMKEHDEEEIKRIIRNSCFGEELTAKLNKSKEALKQHHENRKIEYQVINKKDGK